MLLTIRSEDVKTGFAVSITLPGHSLIWLDRVLHHARATEVRRKRSMNQHRGVRCWGYNYGGALGNGTAGRHSSPGLVVGT